jgi:hypothetical protein
MKNKFIIFVILLISFSLIYQYTPNITSYTIYNVGDSFESGSKTITVKKISQSNVVIDVDGVKNIIALGDKKIVNGVEIELLNLFYVDEIESRNVELSINATITITGCGDGDCKSDENSNNCCIDCGCPTDYTCEEEGCSYSPPNECKKHEECDDGDPETIDLCIKVIPRVCKHYSEKECESNEGCDDGEDCTNDECKENICFNTDIEDCGDEEEIILEETGENEKIGFFSKLANFFKNLF